MNEGLTGLERHEGEWLMTELSFLGELENMHKSSSPKPLKTNILVDFDEMWWIIDLYFGQKEQFKVKNDLKMDSFLK